MNKRILFLLLCLIAMLSVSAVSAIDDNVTEDNLNVKGDFSSSEQVFVTEGMESNLGSNEDSSEDLSSDLNLKNFESNVNVTSNNQVFKSISHDNPVFVNSDEDNNVTLVTSDVVMYYCNGSRISCYLHDNNGPLVEKTVTFNFNGRIYNRLTDFRGYVSLACNVFPGVYPVNVSYGNISSSITVTVLSTIVSNDVVKNYGDTPLASVTFLNSQGTVLSNTNVSFSINGKFYQNVTGTDGTAYLSIILNPGVYICTAYNPFNGEQNGFNITIIGILPDIVVDVGEAIENKNIDINVTLPNDATGIVNLSAGIYKLKSSLVNGIATFNIPGLSSGRYLLKVSYGGDDKYPSNNITKYLVVIVNESPSLQVNNVSKYYKGSDALYAILKDYQNNPIANVNVTFNINGNNYVRKTNDNGLATMNINLKPGQYNVTSKYGVVSVNSIIDIYSTIEAKNIIKMYKNDTQFYAKFLNSAGNPLSNTNVKFNINGVFYTREINNDGIARLGINLRQGYYILTAINPINDEQAGYNVTVQSLVDANDLIKYYKNDSKFQAKIYNKDGSIDINKNIQFNINGVFYTRTTDENGVARLGINLRPGDYVITTIVDGLESGNNVKILPTILASDLNMNFQDGSKFSVTILDDKGEPASDEMVSFNVNGVFYDRVTDGDGVASLTINLFKGEYIITSIWNGYQVGNKITIY